MESKQVYKAIANVMQDLTAEGISKNRTNQKQGYAFRGIDDVYNTLSGLLVKHGLLILPNAQGHTVVERVSNNGGALFSVTLKVEFTLVSIEDGSSHIVTMYGEAMDSGDKATNKAMSAAYKYACIQAFCIPTEGDNDADAQTHEVAARPSKNKEQAEFDYELKLLQQATDAASGGVESYKKFWTKLGSKGQHIIGESRHADFKAKAEEADSYVPQ